MGRYSDVVAALTAALLVMAAIASHLGLLPAVTAADHVWLDSSAGVAVGVILGQRQTTNGAGKKADVANARLDAIGAPAAAAIPPPAPTA